LISVEQAGGILLACAGLTLLLLAGCGALIWIKARSHADCASDFATVRQELERTKMKLWRSVQKQLSRSGLDLEDEAGELPSLPRSPVVKDANQARASIRQQIEANRRINGR
jgi:outer membrane lipopolysaccharide assembly protein LptE/RlpB